MLPEWAASGNWLVTSVSAKVDLVSRLRHALNAVGKVLYATDCSPLSAGLYKADGGFICLPGQTEGFLSHLIAECKQRNISVVIPTRDGDLETLSAHRSELAKHQIWVLCSAADTLAICQDKVSFHRFCGEHGIPVLPRVSHLEPYASPLFARPRTGSASTGCQLVQTEEDWLRFTQTSSEPDWVVQPLCRISEYTIDALFDDVGQPTQWVSRQRLRVMGGESKVSQVVQIDALDALVECVSQALELCGPVTLQAFWSEHEGPWLIEINPRFGGARALSDEAGLATSERLVSLVRGDRQDFYQTRPIKQGLMHLRFSDDLFISPTNLYRLD